MTAPWRTRLHTLSRHPAWPIAAVWLLVAVGVALRLQAYLQNASLWIDEAMLALNVVYRSPEQLLEPLDLNQGAPVGYLLLSKLTVTLFGPGELALRGPSLAAGLVGLGLFTHVAYRLLPVEAARVAVGLFAVSPHLVGYSAEYKQYELDATVGIALLALALPAWGTASTWALVRLALGGAVAVWFSHPAAFVLGGVGLPLLIDAARARRVGKALVVAAWAASFAVCFLLFTRKLGMNAYLIEYWSGKFWPLPPKKIGDVAWLVHHILEFFERPGGFAASQFGSGGLAAVCAALGLTALAKRDWRVAVGLAGPVALALLASALKKYPFAGRLLLFAVPLMLLAVAAGAAELQRRLAPLGRGAGWLIVLVLAVPCVAEAHWHLTRPMHPEDAREAIAFAHNGYQPGDGVYVYYGADPAFGYYHPRYPFPPEHVRHGVENRGGDPLLFRDELRHFARYRRVWVIVAHRQVAEESAIRAYLEDVGSCGEALKLRDAACYRYDLAGHPELTAGR